jgi:hypothetical protein
MLTIVRRRSASSSRRCTNPARLSSPTSRLVVAGVKPIRSASSLTLAGPPIVRATRGATWRSPSSDFSKASRSSSCFGLLFGGDFFSPTMTPESRVSRSVASDMGASRFFVDVLAAINFLCYKSY